MSTEIQFERRPKDEDTWEPISWEEVLEVFSRNFIDAEIALQVLIDLGSTQTTFFDYRVKKEINDD